MDELHVGPSAGEPHQRRREPGPGEQEQLRESADLAGGQQPAQVLQAFQLGDVDRRLGALIRVRVCCLARLNGLSAY
ncbi:hypothetical protein Mam01_37500 [Microbispora amethystogenes]|uniref:Uncharacterized protein n=1 Tax=Microbispora amethystogenes TaxID=1427754 RepID=A0ABQ4FFI5_9ACTN|nr:hypothetical protein Mam01_37500 [Microbispora amethystogenes]